MTIDFGKIYLPVYKLTRVIAHLVLRPFFSIHVAGILNIPAKGPFLLLPKHQRWVDIPLLGLTMPRHLYYIARHDLFRFPLAGQLLSSLGGLPLNRESPSKSIRSVKRVLTLLKEGEGIVLFPEGTYYRDRMGKGRRGLTRLIVSRYSIPIIPVGIRYSKTGGRTGVRIEIGDRVIPDADDIDSGIDLAFREIARLSGL